ncbi:Proline iminopeptidase [Lachnellula suecica]|uniref:Proline iminopeptidase n=1 Tax=Lachnellula suecica TaxID=602035 RepID=A0A8T9CMC1_9HELO|nr:Proline iminopeptidase [Lachnellula suecica]
MAPLYTPFPSNKSGHLQVSGNHSLFWEECGNPTGAPIIFLHGGPGNGTQEHSRRYFDPAHYRIVLLDQRGAGKSTPHASLESNTTWDLVSDIEVLRKHLSIERWIVFGGSWGSCLALAYSQKHTDVCLGLILRGIFTLRKEELEWFYQKGADNIFPDRFLAFKAVIPESERDDLMGAYYKRLTGDNEEEKLKCASAWSKWELSTLRIVPDKTDVAKVSDAKWALAFARIECHYFVNNGWMGDGQLIEEAHKIAHLPIVIVQGRYDVVCPTKTSWDLYQALGGESNKGVEYRIIDDAGHSEKERGIQGLLVDATEKFKSIKA